jgi:hypothetical protein
VPASRRDWIESVTSAMAEILKGEKYALGGFAPK